VGAHHSSPAATTGPSSRLTLCVTGVNCRPVREVLTSSRARRGRAPTSSPSARARRDQLLGIDLFSCLAESKVIVEDFRRDYDEHRPHSALRLAAPARFAHAWEIQNDHTIDINDDRLSRGWTDERGPARSRMRITAERSSDRLDDCLVSGNRGRLEFQASPPDRDRVSRPMKFQRLIDPRIDAFLRLRNRRQPRLLIVTDSRGFDYEGGARNTRRSYIRSLQRDYQVTLVADSQFTLVDFLASVSREDYQAIILHCGVVDASPRPMDSLHRLLGSRTGRREWDALRTANADHYNIPFPTRFEGEATTTLYSLEYLRERVLPELATISKLIWISSNRFVKGWDGTWQRGRPKNVNDVIRRFDEEMLAALPRTVDLWDWSPEQVMRMTIDNVHFTSPGFREIERRVRDRLAALLD
jgi:hypothetical protein